MTVKKNHPVQLNGIENLFFFFNFFFQQGPPPDVFQKFISHYRLLNFKHIRGDPVEKKH